SPRSRSTEDAGSTLRRSSGSTVRRAFISTLSPALSAFSREAAFTRHTRDGVVRAWGDSVLRPDAPILPGDVLGRATVFRRARLIVDWRTGYVAIVRVGAA